MTCEKCNTMAQIYDKTNTSLLYSDYEPINLFEMCPGYAKQGEYIYYESATTPRSKFILPKEKISNQHSHTYAHTQNIICGATYNFTFDCDP